MKGPDWKGAMLRYPFWNASIMIRKELRGSHDSASGGFRRFFFGDAGTRPLMEEFLVDKPPRVADLFFRDHNLFFFPEKKGSTLKRTYPQVVFLFPKEFLSISCVTFRGFFFGMVLGPRQWSVFESFCFLEKNDGEDLRTITTAATIMFIIYCMHLYIYSSTYTYINLQQQQQQFSSVSLSLDHFFAPPPKKSSTNPGEDVMRVQQTETFEARLASPLLPFYATWQAVIRTEFPLRRGKVGPYNR